MWGWSPWATVLGILLLPSLGVGLLLTAAYGVGYIGALYRELWAAPVDVALDPAPGAEPAWPRYFVNQAFDDLRQGWSERLEAADRVRDACWRAIRDRLLYWESPVIRLLLTAVTGIGMVISFILGAVIAGAVVAAHWVAAFLLAVVTGLTGVLLRVGDLAYLRMVRRARTTCPNGGCYQEITCPVYACRECGRKHRDIRPGRYGLLRRICQCTARLPTRLAPASRTLDPSCPICGMQLPMGAGAARELTIAMVGPMGAGKTRLAVGMVMALEGAFIGQREPALLTDDTRERFLDLKAAIIRDEPIPETKSAPQTAYSLHVKPNRRPGRVIHIFDVAGAWFHSREERGLTTEVLHVHDLRYLRRARSFVYVVDPLAIDELWEGLPPKLQDRLLELRPERPASAWRTFQQTLQSLTDMGVQTRRKRLAVAVSKADKLERRFPLNPRADDDSGKVAGGLTELGLGSLVRTAGRFRPQFFYTAATLNGGQVHRSVVELANWVIPRSGWIR
jgi:hypothetical protein